jgi:hypothetical protein
LKLNFFQASSRNFSLNREADPDSRATLRQILRWKRIAAASMLVCATSTAIVLAQQAPPVLNQPYHCTSGLTFTILDCKPYGKDQMCTWREDDKNGRQVTTTNSLWTQMTGRLAGCSVASAAKPAAAGAPAASAPGAPGALNPAYLNQLPSVDQVMSQLKGTDAKDTTNLELGTFRQLKQMIQDLAGSRWFHNQLTPDESRLLGAYDLAYNNLAKPLNFPFDNYFGQPALLSKLAATFPMVQVISQWEGGNQKAAAASAANLPPAPKPASPSAPAAGKVPAAMPMSANAAVQRCIELGGSVATCQGGALSASIYSKMPSDPFAPFLSLTGSYKAPGGLVMDFSIGNVALSGCGQLQLDTHKYTIQKQGNQLVINIANQPQPILIALGSDGKITGPASVQIAGQVITGYQDGIAGTKDLRTNTPVPGTVHAVHNPIYAAKTVSCGVGSMSPGAIDLPDSAPFAFTGMNPAVMLFPDPATAQRNEAPGPRVIGSYASAGGLKIVFRDTGAIIDCSQAHIASTYQVASTASGVAITVKNGSAPFTLALQPDGSLTGLSTVTISGRQLSSMNGNAPTFTATSASCAAGTLTGAK